MKLKGFTLAEVLITLAIIGVIASMTIPSLNYNIQKQQAGPGLMKGINEVQQATMTLMRDNEVRKLDNIKLNGNNLDTEGTPCTAETFLQCITYTPGTNRTSGLNFIVNNNPPSYLTYQLGAFSLGNHRHPMYIGNNGISYIYLDEIPSANNAVLSRYLLDINGAKNPNTIGKDAFIIGVTKRGDVIAFGSTAWRDAVTGNNDNWTADCANNVRPTGNGETCSGSIVENGGEVRYRF